MSKIAFTGGSITAGLGWNLPDEQDLMWVNLVHKNCFSDLSCINAARNGAPNAFIFQKSIDLVVNTNDLAYLFCSWVSAPRYFIDPGFELYTTSVHFGPNSAIHDVDLNTGTIPKKYIENLKNRFLALHHYHHDIVMIVEYVNIINKLCKQKNITVYHVNDSCGWDKNYFDRLENVSPEEYTAFTKTSILNIINRSDDDIFKLYTKLHNEYDSAGGIDESSWINLYSSWIDNKIDRNHDGQHPGQQSNFNYYITVNNFLKSQ
jgi:hypothetical protein